MIIGIPLTQGKMAFVDAVDWAVVSRHTWCAHRHAHIWYAVTNVCGKTIGMHRLITGVKGADHKDNNGLNNRRRNLRRASAGEQVWNSRKQKNNTSGFKGVVWDPLNKKWRAQIGYKRRVINLGRFPTKESAARAYDEEANRLFGDFANINFPKIC